MSVTNREKQRYKKGQIIKVQRDPNNLAQLDKFSQGINVVKTSEIKTKYLPVPKKQARDVNFLTQGSDTPFYREND